MLLAKAQHALMDLTYIGIAVPLQPQPPPKPPSHPSARERQLDAEYQRACSEWVERVIQLHLKHFPPSS